MRSIDSRLRWGVWLVAALTLASSAGAQRARLPAREVAEISDEALRVVVPPEQDLSGVQVAKRGIAFDVKRTLAAFGAPTVRVSALRLTRDVTVVSRSVLHDCSQAEQKPCAALGSRVYIYVEPRVITSSRAVVRVNISWTDRRHFGANGALSGGGYLAGASHKLYFVRSASGVWTLEREDPSVTTS